MIIGNAALPYASGNPWTIDPTRKQPDAHQQVPAMPSFTAASGAGRSAPRCQKTASAIGSRPASESTSVPSGPP